MKLGIGEIRPVSCISIKASKMPKKIDIPRVSAILPLT